MASRWAAAISGYTHADGSQMHLKGVVYCIDKRVDVLRMKAQTSYGAPCLSAPTMYGPK